MIKDRVYSREESMGNLLNQLEISTDMQNIGLLSKATTCAYLHKYAAEYVALLLAVKSGYVDIANCLMNALDLSTEDRQALSLFMYATNGNNKEADRLLRENKEINVNANFVGETALHAAAREGHGSMVTLLLSITGIEVNTPGGFDNTALHAAAKYDRHKIVDQLLQAPMV